MISLIVCSINIEKFNNLNKNIEQTIGVEHEVIRIDNSKNKYSLCQAYNTGASQAEFPILCFIHEDIKFYSDDWGKSLIQYFENEKTGLIGVAGSQYKTRTINGWWLPDSSFSKMKMIQGNKKNGSVNTINSQASGVEKAVCIDGVFMATTREIWTPIRFDETTLRKFHCYDLDFSLSVFSKGYDVIITYDILLEHFSEGSFDKTWYEESLKLHEKWKKHLPASLPSNLESDKVRAEWIAKKIITQFLVVNQYSLRTVLKNIFGNMYKFSFKWCLICIFEYYKAKKGHG